MLRTIAFARLAWLATLTAAFLLSSCSKKKTPVEPFPDMIGTPSSSQLIVYPDVPLTTYFMMDTLISGPPGDPPLKRLICSQDDSLLATATERAGSSSTVHAFIFDFSAAATFQAFRQEPSGAYRLLKDYLLQPVKRYPYGNTDAFTFDDPSPSAMALQSYVARGVINDAVTPSSPLTNPARVTVTPTPSIVYMGHLNMCGDVPPAGEPVDSLLAMSWGAVPGAAGYWVQVFQFGVGADVPASRFPAPAYVGRSIDFFLAYFPGVVTSYKIGDPLPPGAQVVTQKTLLNSTDYAVRITAVNDQGELIAYPGESSRAYVYIRDPDEEGHYSLRSLGAVVVHTGTAGACPPIPPCGQALGVALPNVKVFPPNGVPTSIQ